MSAQQIVDMTDDPALLDKCANCIILLKIDTKTKRSLPEMSKK